MEMGGRFIRFGTPGHPDIIGMLQRGRFLAIEVKRPGKTPSSAQNAFLYYVNAGGGFGCWVDSVDKLALLLQKI